MHAVVPQHGDDVVDDDLAVQDRDAVAIPIEALDVLDAHVDHAATPRRGVYTVPNFSSPAHVAAPNA